MVMLLALALQLQLAGPLPARPVALPSPAPDEDSLRDVGRAHDAQAGFERGRRYVLPWGADSGGRCDVHVGRFCWWYEEGSATPPAEPPEVSRRRAELLQELDTLGERRPGDAWIVGMRVYYRVDDRRPDGADSVARACVASGWWCGALRAYVAQARGDFRAADSGFASALAAMPDSVRCAWRDVSSLLRGNTRDRYEHLACAERVPLETRYWLLATPRLGAGANEWRAEFYARRVATTLLASAVTPHRLSWGRDTEELVLRYGWPLDWSRIPPRPLESALEAAVMGHDPAPSFHYGPAEALLDSTASSGDDGWDLRDLRAESRYAHRAIRRVAGVAAQLARFRRGDSTLLAAAWTADDDSLVAPAAVLGALRPDGGLATIGADSGGRGHALLTVAGAPLLAGVELTDSARATLARSRVLFPPRRDTTPILLSDLLVYRPESDATPSVAEAAALAIPGDTASVARPIGLYWESYGADSAGAEVETAVIVERIDQGFFRGFRQRVGLADPDSPVQVRWSEPRPSRDGVAPRALSLDLATLPSGRYRITVAVTPATGAGAVTSRELTLREK